MVLIKSGGIRAGRVVNGPTLDFDHNVLKLTFLSSEYGAPTYQARGRTESAGDYHRAGKILFPVWAMARFFDVSDSYHIFSFYRRYGILFFHENQTSLR